MQSLPDALAPLAAFSQFILYKLVPSKRQPGKMDKLPVDYRTLQVFKKDDGWQQDPAAWTSADQAIVTAKLCGDEYGVGFFFTPSDPFFFLDLDGCLQADEKTWSPLALSLINRLPGAAIEISQSGKGLHIFGTGHVPEHGCKNQPLGLELYTEGRFVALTGSQAMGSASVDCSATLGPLVSEYFPPSQTVRRDDWTTEPLPEWTDLGSDAAIIKKALAATSAAGKFGGRATFRDLWENDEAALAVAWPPTNELDPYDRSHADMALAQHLAFWTGCNCERIQSLMEQSALVREKWERDDYIIGTISRAVSLQETVYTGGKTKEPPRVPVQPAADPLGQLTGPELLAGYQFLGVTQQLEHFAGCVYIQDEHKVFAPNGARLKSEQFNATYGGYVFQLDGEASGKTTKKAWEAFTESQAIRYPKAESTTFRPDLPPGELVQHEGRVLVNTYIPVPTPRLEGDATPFLDHLAKLLPVPEDREILLAYMAACIQHKGVKFQWAPLLQGAPGNGKTLFTRCVEFAIGQRYTHLPFAGEIAEKFNDWLFDMLFIGVEDVYVPEHKKEVIEILKPMITNNRLAKRAMQQGQVMHPSCANFMLNSNHKDGIRKTIDDRRFAVFYTAQQTNADILRDGMGGDYFPDLYRWLRAEGYAIVANYLETYPIPHALNPAGACHRAPDTSSTHEAVEASRGGIEQEILEAISEGRPGFAGGWVSSMALDRLLQVQRATRQIPPNKRRAMLQSLGYDWHPSLPDGRVNNVVAPDGGKTRLFVKKGSILENLTTPADVAKRYQADQGLAGGAAMMVAEKFSN